MWGGGREVLLGSFNLIGLRTQVKDEALPSHGGERVREQRSGPRTPASTPHLQLLSSSIIAATRYPSRIHHLH